MHEDKQANANEELNLPAELISFAGALDQFQAKSVSSDRDRILFEAGRSAAQGELNQVRAAHRRSIRLWQTAATVLLTVSIGLGTRVGLQKDVDSQIASKQVSDAPIVATSPSISSPPVSIPSENQSDSPSVTHTKKIESLAETQGVTIDQSGERMADELRARQTRLEDAFASTNGIDHRPATVYGSSSAADAGSPQIPDANPHGFRRDEQIRGFINQLTQESDL